MPANKINQSAPIIKDKKTIKPHALLTKNDFVFTELSKKEKGLPVKSLSGD